MGAYREIEAGFESGQAGQRGCSEKSAHFPATVALLRPPTIPGLDFTMKPAWGASPLPCGPNRETLITGLITLNAMGLIGERSLEQVLIDRPSPLELWSRVQDGFSLYQPFIGRESVMAEKQLIAKHFPITEMVRSALEWFDLGAIDSDLMEKIAQFPALMNEDYEGRKVCNTFCETVGELSGAIADFINQRFGEANKAEDYTVQKRSQFYAQETENPMESVHIFMPDFVVFENGFERGAVSQAYWDTFILGIHHIQVHLIPMMNVDDLMDVVAMFEEERFDEAKEIEAELAETCGGEVPTDEQITAVIQGKANGCDFIVDADDYRWALEQAEEMEALRKAWNVVNIGGMKGVHNYGRRLKRLPEPANDTEKKLKAWLADVWKLLPKKKGQTSPIQEIYQRSECEGLPFENMYLIDKEENHMVHENLQRFFEGFMQGDDENTYRLDWTASASMVIKAFENLRGIGQLFDRLTTLCDKETPEAEGQ